MGVFSLTFTAKEDGIIFGEYEHPNIVHLHSSMCMSKQFPDSFLTLVQLFPDFYLTLAQLVAMFTSRHNIIGHISKKISLHIIYVPII